MIVAIHQPNFFPWLGYFDKIARADVFCLLDHVQFPKKGGTYVNRVQVLVQGEAAYLTVPVERNYSGVLPINEMKIREQEAWREKMVRTLQANYARAPFFAETMELIEPLLRNPTDQLGEYNEEALRGVCAALGLTTRLVRSSALKVSGQATEMLIQITRVLGSDVYLCGGGAAGYQEDAQYAASGVRLEYQCFQHPRYEQRTAPEFVAGLSIIDPLMWLGAVGTRALLATLPGQGRLSA
jgi:hypothetical protein